MSDSNKSHDANADGGNHESTRLTTRSIASHDAHAHGGNGKYWLVFLALCALTTISFLTYFDIWNDRVPKGVSMALMMGVSCTKALLVMSVFMHLIWESNWKWVLTIPASIMAIFLMLMLVLDIGYRTDNYSHDRWLHSAEPQTAADYDSAHDSADAKIEEHSDEKAH